MSRFEEFYPLLPADSVALSQFGEGRTWSELGRAVDAEVIATYTAGPTQGSPVITRRVVGDGVAWYVGTSLAADSDLGDLLERVLSETGVESAVGGLPRGCEAVRRIGDSGSYLFVLNHTDEQVTVPVSGIDLLTGTALAPVPAGGVAVVREER